MTQGRLPEGRRALAAKIEAGSLDLTLREGVDGHVAVECAGLGTLFETRSAAVANLFGRFWLELIKHESAPQVLIARGVLGDGDGAD